MIETTGQLPACLTADEVRAAKPAPLPAGDFDPLALARDRLVATGQWQPGQSMGRRWPIGCVALEITQRCNLDCTACYLSELSEAVRDLPLDEVFRRIDLIFDHYGPRTSVQVTGGDPTLRQRAELVAIVERIAARGMRPALFTNGIKASRNLLEALAAADLEDVAFHVDMTQGRRGYASEADLDDIREDYIERARGLPLSVYFNTTIFGGNFDQIPDVVAFFVRHSDVVRLASFQPEAETGRGVLGARPARITTQTVIAQIERGAGTKLTFDAAQAGHARCNRYAMALVANGHVHDFYDNPKLYGFVHDRAAALQFDRRHPRKAVQSLVGWLLRNPDILVRGTPWLAAKLWAMRADLVAARGRAGKLSFFIHNFMDACHLERDRITACTFMTMTRDGPISMCLHNAKRDDFILQPVTLAQGEGRQFWNPLSGAITPDAPAPVGTQTMITRKTVKGTAHRLLPLTKQTPTLAARRKRTK